MEAIQVQDVHKTYRGKVHALRGVSLDVMEGEIFGLLGP
ncbi:MAG: ABC transporter ATP-binding protein, partial [Phycisphaerae bacterium]|nr:ABC transporter ATP-binding protein [Phycisphaerae bacterium]